MPPGGLLKLRPLDSRHRQPIGIVLLYVPVWIETTVQKPVPLLLLMKILLVEMIVVVALFR
jgi:hypothetical protein